jgi:hypothetical protein
MRIIKNKMNKFVFFYVIHYHYESYVINYYTLHSRYQDYSFTKFCKIKKIMILLGYQIRFMDENLQIYQKK